MIDNHIHIGRFHNTYYEPVEIIQIVMQSGIEGLSFSSTTSCCDNINYIEVEKEISQILSQISWNTDIIRPYLWYIPDYIRQGVKVENAIANIPYRGIKLHPQAHHWDFANIENTSVLHEILDYAQIHELPVLFHTGHDTTDATDKFCNLLKEHDKVKIILAHSRPLDQTIRLLKKYKNVYCDTAFTPEEDVKQIAAQGLATKIVLGSDFPITHFYRINYPRTDETPLSLKEQYAEDKKKLVIFNDIKESERRSIFNE